MEENMEETISLKELFKTLRKRIALIAFITIMATVASGIISYFVLTPIYQSSTQILVSQAKDDKNSVVYNEIQANLQLINTYNVVLKSPAILEKAISELQLDSTVAELSNQLTVSSEKNSQVISLTVQDKDPALARDIANTVAAVFKEEIVNIMNVDNVSVLAKAEVSETTSPIKPKPTLNMVISLVVGLMLGVGIAFLLEFLDSTLKSEDDIEKSLGLPVLGTIVMMTPEDLKPLNSRSSQRKVV
jgi:capsular polysaccharide biosynthesis protein